MCAYQLLIAHAYINEKINQLINHSNNQSINQHKECLGEEGEVGEEGENYQPGITLTKVLMQP